MNHTILAYTYLFHLSIPNTSSNPETKLDGEKNDLTNIIYEHRL